MKEDKDGINRLATDEKIPIIITGELKSEN